MIRTDDILWCSGCGVEITWSALVIGEHYYCCRDCHDGRPCQCGERMEPDDERRNPRSTTAGIADEGS